MRSNTAFHRGFRRYGAGDLCIARIFPIQNHHKIEPGAGSYFYLDGIYIGIKSNPLCFAGSVGSKNIRLIFGRERPCVFIKIAAIVYSYAFS